jgi:hypothetical protein
MPVTRVCAPKCSAHGCAPAQYAQRWLFRVAGFFDESMVTPNYPT